MLRPLVLVLALLIAGCGGGGGSSAGPSSGAGANPTNSLSVVNAPANLVLEGYPVSAVLARGYDAEGNLVWGPVEAPYAEGMLFPGQPPSVRAVRLTYLRGQGYDLGESELVPLVPTPSPARVTTVLQYAQVAARDIDTNQEQGVVTVNIQNGASASYADSEVYVLILGQDDAATTWYYLDPTTRTMTGFDDTPATLLPQVNGAFVDRDGAPGSGSQKYSIRLDQLTPVSGSPHTYSFECPTTRLVSGRIYVSFGQKLAGVGVQAPSYQVLPPGAAIPLQGTLTSGSRTVTVPSTAGLFAGMGVTGNGLTATNTVQTVQDATTVVLTQPATTSGAQPLNFVPYLKMVPRTTQTTTGTLTAGQGAVTGLGLDATRLLYPNEPVSGTGIQPGTVIQSITSASEIVLNPAPTGSGAQSLTFTPAVNRLALTTPSPTGNPDWGTLFEFMELSVTLDSATDPNPFRILYLNTSVVDFFSIGLGMTVNFADGSSRTVGFPAGTRATLLQDFNALGSAQNGFQAFVTRASNGAPTLVAQTAVANVDRVLRILAPPQITSLGATQAQLANYLQSTIDDGWAQYAGSALNIPDTLQWTGSPYGFKYTGQLISGGLLPMQCTAVPSGQTGLNENYSLPRPTTAIVFQCDDPGGPWSNTGTDAHKRLGSLILSALNRGVFSNYLDWANYQGNVYPGGASTFYTDSQKRYNVYSQILHAHATDDKVYGFGYDDQYGQDPTQSGPVTNRQDGTAPPGNPINQVTLQIPAFTAP